MWPQVQVSQVRKFIHFLHEPVAFQHMYLNTMVRTEKVSGAWQIIILLRREEFPPSGRGRK